MDLMNVMKTDVESTCFCCPQPTRLLLVEPAANFPICDDCLLTLAAAEYLSNRKVVN